jgi:acetyl esterase/lipase
MASRRWGKTPVAITILVLSALVFLPSCGIFAPKTPKSTDDVQIYNDLVYERGAEADTAAHSLDLYIPKTANNYPVVVLVHGGAWAFGGKQYMGGLAYALARNGYAVANINYRLTPRVKHPGHVEDVASAIAWVKGNIAKYGADPDTIFIAGHSAGGHLVSLVALDGKYLKKHGIDPNKDLAGVVSISGVYRINHHVLDPVFTDNKKAWEDASPINHISKDSPPFLILYAEHEMQGKIPLVEQAEEFYESLQDAGVDSKIRQIPGVNHDTIIRSVATKTSQTLPAILNFLKSKR